MKNKLLNPKTIIWYRSKDTFCVRVFGWGIYGISTKASWIPFSIRAGFKKLPIIKGHFIEFMIPLWLQKMKNTIRWQLLGVKSTSLPKKPQRSSVIKKGKQS
jgi:hypothetical protein